MAPAIGYLDRTGHVAHRRLTVAEYHRMGEAGILPSEPICSVEAAIGARLLHPRWRAHATLPRTRTVA